MNFSWLLFAALALQGGSGGQGGGLVAGGLLAMNGRHACVRNQGAVSCWGSNRDGQLGNPTHAGTGEGTAVPTPVEGAGPGAVLQVELGDSHTCVERHRN